MINLTGKTIGKLYVRTFSHRDNKTRQNHWLCECACGNSTSACTSDLLRKTRPKQSCGCLRLEKTKNKAAHNRRGSGKSNLKSLLWTYKKSAKERNIDFLLSEEIFETLVNKNCHYCNLEPSQKHKKRETYGILFYNGIDRIDSNLGYFEENCVPCCKTCNYAKRQMTTLEFKDWINRVFKYFILENI